MLPTPILLFIVAGAAWIVPGGGYLLLNEKSRALIIFISISLTFLLGIYIGSIGVIDPIGSRFAFMGQILNSPAVFLIANVSESGSYPVYGKPAEIGQLYTIIAGMLNLLCIVNSVYTAYVRSTEAVRR